MTTLHRLTLKKRDEFLDELRQGHTVQASCSAVGLSRTALYGLRDRDEKFRAEWDAALEEGTECLEEEARRRAYEGTRNPVFHKGAIVGHIQEYSDTLLIFLLKGRKPEVYRDNATVKHEGEIAIEDAGMTDEQRTLRIAAILQSAELRAAGPGADSGGAAAPDDGGASGA